MNQIIARLEALEKKLRTAPRTNTINGLVFTLDDASIIADCELLRELIGLMKTEVDSGQK
jgi:hypothetical protein